MNKLSITPKGIKFLIIIILTLGIFFRFINLDKKIYWADETFTSLRLSGYTTKEVESQLFDGRIVTIEDIQKYQRTNSQKQITDTIKGLAVEEAQLPPLYFLIARFWVKLFGNSIAITRSISALISLLIFPCTYWLCLELFGSSMVGWIAMAIMAVSPFNVLYAQEARPYSLWAVTIVLSSASFLRALRLKTKVSWLLYAITMTLGLYTYLLTILVAIANGLYVLVIERFRFTKTVIAYILASLLAFLAFVPWILAIVINFESFQETSKWALETMPISNLIQEWMRNISYSFMDFWYFFTYFPDSRFNLSFGIYLIPLLLILVGYSIYFICRESPPKISVFLLTLMGANSLPLMLSDLASGGYRSIMARYFVPTYVGIHLSVAYLLAKKINPINKELFVANLWKLSFVALIMGGIISCSVSSQAETWWTKRTLDHVIVYKIINQTSHPLLILQKDISTVASLSHALNPDVEFQFENTKQPLIIPDKFTNVFLLESSKFPINKFEEDQKLKVKLIYKGRKENLWQVKSSQQNINNK
ncbi:glycosyltransferase family 39 protein [Nostoc sp.]|uniref:glycosyltransferase family 39 protein n=1 Tax=Nostoc sp. TaxID=1180 RepID=UPI002FF5E674